MAQSEVFRCELQADSAEQLRGLIETLAAEVGEIDLGCRAIARVGEAGVRVTAHLTRGQLDTRAATRAAPELEITEIENETESDTLRVAEVGRGNRFAGRADRPTGVARKV